jgi:biopolymer transport protein ExbD
MRACRAAIAEPAEFDAGRRSVWKAASIGCDTACDACARPVTRRDHCVVPDDRVSSYPERMGMNTAGSREINVTPLIDVLLVLLIIFLVMMPIMLRSETVELPPRSTDVSEAISVKLKLEADLSAAIDDGPVFPNHELAARLRAKLPNAKAVFVDIVDGVPWSQVVSTVDTIRGVGNGLGRTDLSVAVRLRGE